MGGRGGRVIGLVPGQIVTDSLSDELTVEDGSAVADPTRDLAKVAVIERHLGTGRIALGSSAGSGSKAAHSPRRSPTTRITW